VIDPLVAVTVTVYVPSVVRRDVDTVRVDVPLPPDVSATLVGLRDTVGHTKTRPDDEIDAVKDTLPENP